MKVFYHCVNSQMFLTAEDSPGEDWIETAPPDADKIYCWKNGEWILSDESQTIIVHIYSKLKLLRKLKALGVWEAVKSTLETEGAYDEWLVAQELASNDPLMLSMTALFQQNFPEYNIQEILEESEV